MMATRRLIKNSVISRLEPPAPRPSSHLHSLAAGDAVGDGAQPGELVRVSPEPMPVIEVDDLAVLLDVGRNLVEELLALAAVDRDPLLVDELVGFLVAPAR